jgi:hypothetical protein
MREQVGHGYVYHRLCPIHTHTHTPPRITSNTLPAEYTPEKECLNRPALCEKRCNEHACDADGGTCQHSHASRSDWQRQMLGCRMVGQACELSACKPYAAACSQLTSMCGLGCRMVGQACELIYSPCVQARPYAACLRAANAHVCGVHVRNTLTYAALTYAACMSAYVSAFGLHVSWRIRGWATNSCIRQRMRPGKPHTPHTLAYSGWATITCQSAQREKG